MTEKSKIHYDYGSESVSEQAEVLYKTIVQTQHDTGDTLWLLADPVLLLQRTDIPFVQGLVNRSPTPIPLPHNALPQSDYPWLLALDTDNDDDLFLLQQSIKVALEELHPNLLCQSKGRGICGWLTSRAKKNDLVKQLGHTTIQNQPDTSTLLLRYYDPAVHSLLWPHLSDLQQRRLGGLLSCWIFPDGDGQVVKHRFQPAPMLYSTFSLALSSEQCDFILNTCGITNRALRRYRQQNSDVSRHTELASAAYVRHALARLAGHPALHNAEDKARFAYQLLHTHPLIDQHPEIVNLLDHDTFNDEIGWTKRTLNISPEIWQRYAHELDESPMENHA